MTRRTPRRRPEDSRPSKLTPEVAEKLVKLVRSGAYGSTAARASGISERTLHRWLSRGAQALDEHERTGQPVPAKERMYVDLLGDLDQASALREAAWSSALHRRIMGGAVVEERIERTLDGGEVTTVKRQPPDGALALRALGIVAPTRYSAAATGEHDLAGAFAGHNDADDQGDPVARMRAAVLAANPGWKPPAEITVGVLEDPASDTSGTPVHGEEVAS